MSALDRIREKFRIPIPSTSKASKSPSAGSAGSLDEHLNIQGTPSAGSAGAPHKQINFSGACLTPVQEAARHDVLANFRLARTSSARSLIASSLTAPWY